MKRGSIEGEEYDKINNERSREYKETVANMLCRNGQISSLIEDMASNLYIEFLMTVAFSKTNSRCNHMVSIKWSCKCRFNERPTTRSATLIIDNQEVFFWLVR